MTACGICLLIIWERNGLISMEYRNELKFEVSDREIARMKYRLFPLMRCDSHQNSDGYAVRSLYFDDIYDTCMKEKEEGAGYRIKYRLRIYNADMDLIRLEKKEQVPADDEKGIADVDERRKRRACVW